MKNVISLEIYYISLRYRRNHLLHGHPSIAIVKAWLWLISSFRFNNSGTSQLHQAVFPFKKLASSLAHHTVKSADNSGLSLGAELGSWFKSASIGYIIPSKWYQKYVNRTLSDMSVSTVPGWTLITCNSGFSSWRVSKNLNAATLLAV